MGFFSNLFGGRDSKSKGASNPAPQPPPAAPEPAPESITWPELTPAEFQARVASGGVVVLDVRTAGEHEMRRIDGSRLLPVQVLPQRIGELDPSATYLVHCEHGMRSTDACYFLKMRGFLHIFELAGGLASYTGPTVRGPVAR